MLLVTAHTDKVPTGWTLSVCTVKWKADILPFFGNHLKAPSIYYTCIYNTVKPVLTDHCNERPPVLKDHKVFSKGQTCQHNWIYHQRPALRDHTL